MFFENTIFYVFWLLNMFSCFCIMENGKLFSKVVAKYDLNLVNLLTRGEDWSLSFNPKNLILLFWIHWRNKSLWRYLNEKCDTKYYLLCLKNQDYSNACYFDLSYDCMIGCFLIVFLYILRSYPYLPIHCW